MYHDFYSMYMDYVENTDMIHIWKYSKGTITSYKILCSLNKINTFCERCVCVHKYPGLFAEMFILGVTTKPSRMNFILILLFQREDATEQPLKKQNSVHILFTWH
jgi:hypothetical protein